MSAKQQTGFTLSGMMMFLLVMVLALYTASRIVPSYMDYWVVDKTLKNLVALPDIQNSSDTSIRDQFDKQLSVNNITQITRDDLSIERKSGGIRLSVEFSAKKPFLGRMSLCLDFQSAAHSGGGD